MAKYSGGDDFNDTNTMILKFSFLLFVLLIFIFSIYLGVMLVSFILQPRAVTYVINGLHEGGSSITIKQDPNAVDSKPIWRSNNRDHGIEFTWSVWLFVDNVNDKESKDYQCVFTKGGNGNSYSTASNFTPGSSINNGPGIYIDPKTNTLRVLMDIVGNNSNQTGPSYIDIDNFPLKKWFHVAIRLENTLLDVYINGTIAGRLQLPNVPNQNYDDIFVCPNGGFRGRLSNLIYMTYAANVNQIQNLVIAGPNMTSTQSTNSYSANYLSNTWYTTKF